MDLKLINRIFAGGVFLISLLVLMLTVQPSVSFWDCGEFIAAGYYLQVPHPPGAPLFLLLGRLFSIIPFAENIAYKVNIISVLSSALSVLFLYLVAVKLIENYRGKDYKSKFEAIAVYISAAIGAFSFSFSDTFWFNGVEAEVYAFSTFLFAAITWLIMTWNEKADEPGSERYIVMIGYLIGLSTGVHLMAVLAMVPVVMIIMFKKFVNDEVVLKKSAYVFLAHVGILLLTAVLSWKGAKSSTFPSQLQYMEYDSSFKVMLLLISLPLIGVGLFAFKSSIKNSIYLPMIIGGVFLALTYPGIVKYLPKFIASIAQTSSTTGLVVFLIIVAALGLVIYLSKTKNMPTLHLIAVFFAFNLIGFTTFTLVIVRANQNPPMNENEPDTFTELVSYLGREQYGNFPTFKRRFSAEPHQQAIYKNYSSDLDFFWNYQMHHMMTRYLFWNYAGRESWQPDAGSNIAPFNGIGNALGKIINVRFGGQFKDSLLGIPLLLGLLGVYFHFRKDWKMATIFMIMFFFMGYLTAFYQNQQQPQPRERDYFYVGAFFVYSIWIAIGLYGLVQLVTEKIKSQSLQKGLVYGILALGVLGVPVKMLASNFNTHDRSKNFVPWDYSYNMLQSCEPNSILFTNGDNDTFPLWYLQDVEGIRRDVKIVNLSLINTDWYIKQMKNNDPYKVGVVKMSFSDQEAEKIANEGGVLWPENGQDIVIPFPKDKDKLAKFLKEYKITDSLSASTNALVFNLKPTIGGRAIRTQDLMIKDILEQNNWERPVYFAITCSEDSKIGLDQFLVMEGMAFKLTPNRVSDIKSYVNEAALSKNLLEENPSYSKDFKPGFKFRGLNDPSIFWDENHTRMMQNYRNLYSRLAQYYIEVGQNDKALNVVSAMDKIMPYSSFPIEYYQAFDFADIYTKAGNPAKGNEYFKTAVAMCDSIVDENPANVMPLELLISNLINKGDLVNAEAKLNKYASLKAARQNYAQYFAGQIEALKKYPGKSFEEIQKIYNDSIANLQKQQTPAK